MGNLIDLDGVVYRVGGFLDHGDKVALWREPQAQTPNGGRARRAGAARTPEKLYIELRAAPNFDYDPSDPRASVRIAPKLVSVRNLAEASAVAQDFIRQNALGSGNWIGGEVTDASGRLVATVSYNGRVWSPGGEEIKAVGHTPNETEEINIANPGDIYAHLTMGLFRFWFGTVGTTFVYVWTRSSDFESAFEVAVEWLDEQGAAGHFTTVTENDLKAAAEEEGIEWQESWPDWEDPEFQRLVDAAEADLTVIGHTTLKHGTHLVSYEWGADEITDPEEWKRVALASYEEDKSILDFEREAFHPDEDNAEGGFRVIVSNGDVDATEWTDIAAATGEPSVEGEEVSKQEVHTDLEHLLGQGRHRGAYSGDTGATLADVLVMETARDREDAIVDAAIGRLAYGPNDESYVSYVGED